MPHAETLPERIALFDLDGTLLAWDCQLLFRHFVLRREPWRGIFLPVFLVFLPFAGCLGNGADEARVPEFPVADESGETGGHARVISPVT